MPWIFRVISVVFCLTTSACALFEERAGPELMFGPREQVFYATYEETWRAANFVLQPYPMRTSLMDQGTIETDSIRGHRIWWPVYKSEHSPSGETYRLLVRVVRGGLDGKPATKVTIVKEAYLQVDFFSTPKSIPSDGFEEKSILYRIGREIQIDRAITRAQKSQSSRAN